jgi:hypothetical protein
MRTQAGNGKIIELTEEQYFQLWFDQPTKLRVLDRAIRAALKEFKDPRKVKRYNLSPRSVAAGQSNIVSIETYSIQNKEESIQNSRLKKGDSHTPNAVAKIAKARTGTTQPAKVRTKISESMTGMERTAEDKANKSAAASKRWEKYRAEKENQNV